MLIFDGSGFRDCINDLTGICKGHQALSSSKFPVRLIKKRRKASRWRHGLLQTDMKLHYLHSEPSVEAQETRRSGMWSSLITSYLTASPATSRSLLRIPCYVKLVTCQNQSQDGVRWSGQPGRRFLQLLLRVAAAGTGVRLCRSRGGIFSVHSNYSWRDTFTAPPGLTKAPNWLGKTAKKINLGAALTPAVRTAALINLVHP